MSIKNKLVQLGFSELEAAVYEYLLQNNVCTATQVADAVKVSRTRSYQILNKLISQNACTEIRGSIKKYRATDPESVIRFLTDNIATKQQLLAEIAPALRNLFQTNREKNIPQDFIQVLYTRASVLQKLATLENATQSTILAFNKPPYFMNNDYDPQKIDPELRQPEQQALNRKVQIRSLYEQERDVKDFSAKIAGFMQAGEDARIIDQLPFKMIVFDFHTVVIALLNKQLPGNNFVTMVINHDDFATAMSTIFDIFWARGQQL